MAVGVPPPSAGAGDQQVTISRRVFLRRSAVNLNDQKLTILLTLIGSSIGAILVQYIRANLLRQMLPLLVIGISQYFLLMPWLGEECRQRRLGALLLGLLGWGGSVFTTVSLALVLAPFMR